MIFKLYTNPTRGTDKSLHPCFNTADGFREATEGKTTVVMIHIGDENDTNYRGLLKFLYALIKEMDLRRKRDVLVNE